LECIFDLSIFAVRNFAWELNYKLILNADNTAVSTKRTKIKIFEVEISGFGFLSAAERSMYPSIYNHTQEAEFRDEKGGSGQANQWK
jgi:hypothetical protein